jgi:hypothetical protein
MPDSHENSRGAHGTPATLAVSDLTYVRLAPYKETPEWYRTTVSIEGAKRWFEKSRVSVVARDRDSIILSMPKAYADTRKGISTLIVEERAPGERPVYAVESKASGQGFSESAIEWEGALPERVDLQLGPGGRIVIPAIFRDAMQVKEGGRLMARMVDGELRLVTPRMAVRRAQELVRRLIPGDESLSDALIEERRREVAEEFGDG